MEVEPEKQEAPQKIEEEVPLEQQGQQVQGKIDPIKADFIARLTSNLMAAAKKG
jgi:hypothetical protein